MVDFDARYWREHWSAANAEATTSVPVNPYLPIETENLPVGTALDAGCGTGAEAVWLAEREWKVTGADISHRALALAREREALASPAHPIEWLDTDLAQWQPERTWNLVVSNYAHASIGQRALYQRLASWVAPGGTLLLVGHRHEHPQGDDHHQPPAEAATTLVDIVSLLDPAHWRVDSAYETTRTAHHGGQATPLRDVVVRAHRND